MRTEYGEFEHDSHICVSDLQLWGLRGKSRET